MALLAASAVAAMGSHALASPGVGDPADELFPAALAELEHYDLGPAADPVRRAADGTWHPAATGVGLDVIDTLAAVIHVIQALRREPDPAEAMRRAVLLGGDTDTAAAIVGGVLGARHPDLDMPWSSGVALPASLATLASALGHLLEGAG